MAISHLHRRFHHRIAMTMQCIVDENFMNFLSLNFVTTRCNKIINYFVATEEQPNDVVTSPHHHYIFDCVSNPLHEPARPSGAGRARCDAPQYFFYFFFIKSVTIEIVITTYAFFQKRWVEPHKIDENDPFFDLLYIPIYSLTRDQ